MNSGKINLSIVVPIHNAEKFLQRTIGELYSNLKVEEELILVENGSTDNTLNALINFFGTEPPHNVKIEKSAKGLGLALTHGINQAEGRTIIFMQDDLPFAMQELELARQLNVEGKYFIISKYHGNIRGFSLRRIQGLVFIFLRELVLSLRVRDSQATFFGDARIVKKLASACQQKGFLITLELVALARKSDVEIHEIPCNSLSTPIRPTTLKIRDVLQMFVGLFQLKRYLDEVDIENM